MMIFSYSVLAGNNPYFQFQLDKNCYVSGETVRFKNTITHNEKGKDNTLFVDLCGEGYLLSSAVIQRNNNHWEGELVIPDSLQTGVYMVRAYTGSTSGLPTVVYQLIPIINRFGVNEKNEEKKKQINCNPFYNANQNRIQQGFGIKTYTKDSRCATDENIEFIIEKDGVDFIGGILFEVVKLDTVAGEVVEAELPAFQPSSEIKIFNGLTLRGKVIDKTTKAAVEGELVLFSVPDTIALINYSVTDQNGEFQFSIENYYGEQTAIVQTMRKTESLEIELNPMFLLPPASIPFYVPSVLETGEFVSLSIKRAIYTKAYEFGNEKTMSKNQLFYYPFYGFTKEVVYPEIFIDLIDFEEIAKEILPLVKYKRSGSEFGLSLFNPETKNVFNSPWILVDGVPISDITSLNKLNSRDVQRVEIQPATRCYGSLLIDGLVAVYTQKGHFTGMHLPKNAVITKIDTYFQPKVINDIDRLQFRDVLYWFPHIADFERTTLVIVKTSYEKGVYAAIAQGVDVNGQLHRSIFKFNVE
jgi:hypothetical protein